MAGLDARRHRRSHSQRVVRLAEVIVSEVQGDRTLKVLELFAERVGQTSQATAVHPQRVVLLLDVARRYPAHVGRPVDNRLLDGDDL